MLRLLKLPIKVALGLAAVVVVYLGVTFAQVWWASRQQTGASAGAIVVMGAAQWNGKPSPVLEARLDHAAALYRAGRAPMIVVTGGKQPGDRTTQGVTGYDYLVAQGIPASAVKLENQGTDSYQELSAAANILHQDGVAPDVLLVSDPYHAFRIGQIADELGMSAHVSPDDEPSSAYQYARETAAVSLGRLIGYRRLSHVV